MFFVTLDDYTYKVCKTLQDKITVMKLEVLETDSFYHIYNKGINGETIFYTNNNKAYFLKLVSKYLREKASVFAYCLMNNHFHFIIRVEAEQKEVTQSLSNLFNAYAKAFNKENNRTGSLFEKHFKRIRIESDEYLRNLIVYIHLNPTHHLGIDYKKFKYSSYLAILSNKKTEIKRNEVLELFETKNNFIYLHKHIKEIKDKKVILE